VAKTKIDENGLTPRQSQILKFLKACDRQGRMPTVREIGDKFEIVSPNGVMCHLNALHKKGHIVRAENISRGITLSKKSSARHVTDGGNGILDLTQFSGAADCDCKCLGGGRYEIKKGEKLIATITLA